MTYYYLLRISYENSNIDAIFFSNSNAWINFHCKWQIHLELLDFLSFLLGLPYVCISMRSKFVKNLFKKFIRRRQKKYSEVQLLKLRDLGRLIICQKYGTSFVFDFLSLQQMAQVVVTSFLYFFFAHTRQIWYALYSLLKKEGLLHDFQFCLLMPSNKITKAVF